LAGAGYREGIIQRGKTTNKKKKKKKTKPRGERLESSIEMALNWDRQRFHEKGKHWVNRGISGKKRKRRVHSGVGVLEREENLEPKNHTNNTFVSGDARVAGPN